jgi:hypothetical protein
MTKIQIQSEIDPQVLLASVSQIPVNELEYFVRELNALITRKKTNNTEHRDRVLLRKINETVLPQNKSARYIQLHQQLEASNLNDTEHKEFMSLVDEEENLRNQRVKYLIELAQLRSVSLLQLMETLGLNRIPNG